MSSYKDDIEDSIQFMNGEINDIIHKHTRNMLQNVHHKLDVYETNLEYIKNMPIFKELHSKIETLTIENETLKSKLSTDETKKPNIQFVIHEKNDEGKYETESESEEEAEQKHETIYDSEPECESEVELDSENYEKEQLTNNDEVCNENDEMIQSQQETNIEIKCEICKECEIYENYQICLNCFVEAETETEQNEHESYNDVLEGSISDEEEPESGPELELEKKKEHESEQNHGMLDKGNKTFINEDGEDSTMYEDEDEDEDEDEHDESDRDEPEPEKETTTKEEEEEEEEEEDIYDTEDDNAYEGDEYDEGDEGDGIEATKITINGIKYYLEDTTEDLYERLDDGDIGDHVGTYKNKVLILFNTN